MNVIKGFYQELFQQHGSSLFDIPSVQDSAPGWRQALRHYQVEEAILNSLEAYKVKVQGGAPVCVTTGALTFVAVTCPKVPSQEQFQFLVEPLDF